MLRFGLLFLVFSALALSAVAFEAAEKTEIAIDLIRASHAMEPPSLRAQVLAQAADQIEASWAQPAQWHAGAAETLSAIYALQGEAAHGDNALYAKSIAAASHAVALAPVQPQAWARLAAFAQMGLPGVPCSVATCLDMSWRSARMTDPETACIRLRIAHAEGLLIDPNDARIAWYVRSGVAPQEMAQCLDFLPTNTVFRLLINARRPVR